MRLILSAAHPFSALKYFETGGISIEASGLNNISFTASAV
jgi:hypothetical protein